MGLRTWCCVIIITALGDSASSQWALLSAFVAHASPSLDIQCKQLPHGRRVWCWHLGAQRGRQGRRAAPQRSVCDHWLKEEATQTCLWSMPVKTSHNIWDMRALYSTSLRLTYHQNEDNTECVDFILFWVYDHVSCVIPASMCVPQTSQDRVDTHVSSQRV